ARPRAVQVDGDARAPRRDPVDELLPHVLGHPLSVDRAPARTPANPPSPRPAAPREVLCRARPSTASLDWAAWSGCVVRTPWAGRRGWTRCGVQLRGLGPCPGGRLAAKALIRRHDTVLGNPHGRRRSMRARGACTHFYEHLPQAPGI